MNRHLAISVAAFLVGVMLVGCSATTPSLALPPATNQPPDVPNKAGSSPARKSVVIDQFSLERFPETRLKAIPNWNDYYPIDEDSGLIFLRKTNQGSADSYAVYNVAQNKLTPIAFKCSLEKTQLFPLSDPEFALRAGQITFISQTADGTIQAASRISTQNGTCQSVALTNGTWIVPIVAGNNVYTVERYESRVVEVDFNAQKLTELSHLKNQIYKGTFANNKLYFLNSDLSIMTKPATSPLLTSLDLATGRETDVHIPALEKWDFTPKIVRGFTEIKAGGHKLILHANTSLGGSAVSGYYVVDPSDLAKSYWTTAWSSNLDRGDAAYEFDGITISESVYIAGARIPKNGNLILAQNNTAHGLLDAGQALIFKADDVTNYPLGTAVADDQIFWITYGTNGTTLFRTRIGSPEILVEILPKGNSGDYRIGAGEGYVWTYAEDGSRYLRIYDGTSAQLKKTIDIGSWLSNGVTDIAIHAGKAYLTPSYIFSGKAQILVTDIDGSSPDQKIAYPVPADVLSPGGSTLDTSAISVVDEKFYVATHDRDDSKVYLISKDLRTGGVETVTASCGFQYCLSVNTAMPEGRQKLIIRNGVAYIRFYGSNLLTKIDLKSHAAAWLPIGHGANSFAFDGQNIWALTNPEVRNFGRGEKNFIKLEPF